MRRILKSDKGRVDVVSRRIRIYRINAAFGARAKTDLGEMVTSTRPMSLLTGLAKGRDILPRREKEPLVAEAAAESSKVCDRCGFSRKPSARVDRSPSDTENENYKIAYEIARATGERSFVPPRAWLLKLDDEQADGA